MTNTHDNKVPTPDLAAEQAKYEAMAKEKGFASILGVAANSDILKWGKVGGEYTIVDIPLSRATDAMMNAEQKNLLRFLQNTKKITLETRHFGDLTYNVYVAGEELSAIIMQEKSKCHGSCRKA